MVNIMAPAGGDSSHQRDAKKVVWRKRTPIFSNPVIDCNTASEKSKCQYEI